MPPLVTPPVCPVGLETCPVLIELLRLQEECRRLRELSHTDPLTSLYNRRYLMTVLDQEMERTRRTGLPTGLIMLDLDNFKGLNDTLGHPCGDEALRRVAALLKKNIRKLDIPCRYGGDEFALILPGTRLPQAVRLAGRLRDLLANPGQEVAGWTEPLTAGFGVDSLTAQEDSTPEAFLQRVDRLLLAAKARGRNTICYPDSPEVGPETGLTPEERRTFIKGGEASGGRMGGAYG